MDELILDWNEIERIIPGSNLPGSPSHIIKTCLAESQELDPYDQIDKRLDHLIENLQKSFSELER